MPYRRLPNTDKSRLNALVIAHKKYKSIPYNDLAFEHDKSLNLEMYIKNLQQMMSENQNHIESRQNANKEFVKTYKEAKLYVEHFIQVLNLAIIREEIDISKKTLYKLPKSSIIPKYHNHKEFIKLAEAIIEGETKRTSAGGSAIMTPSIAMVKIKFNAFKDMYMRHEIADKSAKRVQDNIIALRKKIDNFIKRLWDDIEYNNKKRSEVNWRELSRDYGISYVYRSYEIQTQTSQPTNKTNEIIYRNF